MTGVLLALTALFGWGFADFLAQRATRKVGVVETLFFTDVFGLVILTPLVFGQLGSLIGNPRGIIILVTLSLVSLFTALLNLEAFRRGKMAVVEPILGLELPFTILLAVALRGERVGLAQGVTMTLVFIGIVLAASARPLRARLGDGKLEKGVLLAAIGAVGLGATNFLIGLASQETSPVLAVWFGRLMLGVILLIYLLVSKRLAPTIRAWNGQVRILSVTSALYLVAFLAFGYAVTMASISTVTTISESYIVLAALLGVIVNRERLRTHQYVGASLAVAGTLFLASMNV
jgi:drug/metabolite transporter (DMT)-like permease